MNVDAELLRWLFDLVEDGGELSCALASFVVADPAVARLLDALAAAEPDIAPAVALASFQPRSNLSECAMSRRPAVPQEGDERDCF